jgi:hypothetical protein
MPAASHVYGNIIVQKTFGSGRLKQSENPFLQEVVLLFHDLFLSLHLLTSVQLVNKSAGEYNTLQPPGFSPRFSKHIQIPYNSGQARRICF